MAIRTITTIQEVCDKCGEDIKSPIRRIVTKDGIKVFIKKGDKDVLVEIVKPDTIYHSHCLRDVVSKTITDIRGE